MVAKTSRRAEDLGTVYQTLFLDLPFAGAKWGMGMGGGKETAEVAWKGYDAWIRWTSASIDDLYRSPFLGAVATRSLDGFLRWQRLSSALTKAFFTGMWQTFGFAQITDMQTLQIEVHALREELRARVQHGTETADGKAEAAVHALREEFPSFTASLPAHRREREAMSGDLLDCFEPVDFAVNSTPAHSEERQDPTDLLDYFEPVDWSTHAAPAYGKDGEAATELAAQMEASPVEVKGDRAGVETARRRVKNWTGQPAAKEKERREKDAVAA